MEDGLPLRLWYETAACDGPEKEWQYEAIPIGNGHIGAMIFGGAESERILINEETVWSGGYGKNPDYNGGIPNTSTAQELHSRLQEVRQILQKTSAAAGAGSAETGQRVHV